MLQEIHIAGHAADTLKTLLDARPGELDLIVITNHYRPFPEWVLGKVRSHLHLVFDDITADFNPPSFVPPAREHLEQALEFARGKTHLVVACHAGMSRSAAVALAIAGREWGTEKALSILNPRRHSPNLRVCKLADQLHPEGRLLEAVVTWGEVNADIPVDDVWPL